MDLLLDTVLLRPYVFLFLLIYLIGCSIQFGVKPALSFLLVGYLLALASELSSIHWGFPYGDYYYIPSTIGRELWVLGVPFMDSLSYVFLAACSYTTALFLLCPFLKDRRGLSLCDTTSQRQGCAPWILGAILMVLLDVIIDPVALQGERWFLGKIYGYRTPGSYFGIPMSNFGGWLLVGIVMIKVFQLILRLWEKQPLDLRWKGLAVVSVWGPLLYVGILIFNLAITLAIGEITLWLVDVFLTGIFFSMGGALILYKLQHPLSSDDRP